MRGCTGELTAGWEQASPPGPASVPSDCHQGTQASSSSVQAELSDQTLLLHILS